MFIVTAKVPRRSVVVGMTLAAFLCCSILTLTLPSGATPVSASGNPDPQGVKSAENRLDYLAEWGWQVAEEPLSVEELLIPEILDDSYAEYMALQQSQGFDLNALTGERVKRYSYAVLNYPTGEEGVQLNLLIYNNTVVGGEVLSPQLDGFLHGLAMPEG